MRNLVVLCAGLVVAAVGLGCNPKHCDDHVGDNCDNPLIDGGGGDADAPIDAFKCTSDGQCTSADSPACDLTNGACVACTASDIGACADTTPVCGSDDMCQSCTSHAQCMSDVCLPSGACDGGSDVAYVQGSGAGGSAGTGSACTFDAPCGTFAAALATDRPIIKVAGTLDEAVSIGSGNVTVFADPGATLTRSSGGAILSVSGDGTSVSIYDLSISNAPNNANGYGIVIPAASGSPTLTLTRVTVSHDPAGGISAASGTITLAQSTVSNNGSFGDSPGISTTGGTLAIQQSTISGNTGGGLSLTNTAFAIVNNFIVGNGAPASLVGGVSFASIASSGTHQLDFNTITANDGAATVNTGVNCGTVTMPVTFDSDIVYGNTVSSGGVQLGGSVNCGAIYSDIGGSDVFAGSGNINADPMFVSLVTPDYHLTSGSPCIGSGDPATSVGSDFDGQARPAGAADIGADQYYP